MKKPTDAWEGLTFEQEQRIATLVADYYMACGKDGFDKANPKYEKIIAYIDALLASQRATLIEEIAEKLKRYDCNHKKHVWVPACRMVRVCKYCGLIEGVWATVQEMRAALAERKDI